MHDLADSSDRSDLRETATAALHQLYRPSLAAFQQQVLLRRSSVCLPACTPIRVWICVSVCTCIRVWILCLSAHSSVGGFYVCLHMHSCMDLSAHGSVCGLVCPSAHASVCGFYVCLHMHPCVDFMSVCTCVRVWIFCLSAHASVCGLVCPSAHASVCGFVCLSAHASVCGFYVCLHMHPCVDFMSVCTCIRVWNLCLSAHAVSYTHLTLPTRSTV